MTDPDRHLCQATSAPSTSRRSCHASSLFPVARTSPAPQTHGRTDLHGPPSLVRCKEAFWISLGSFYQKSTSIAATKRSSPDDEPDAPCPDPLLPHVRTVYTILFWEHRTLPPAHRGPRHLSHVPRSGHPRPALVCQSLAMMRAVEKTLMFATASLGATRRRSPMSPRYKPCGPCRSHSSRP
jgi:hypothetical protein